jgi:hypothetical protein
MYENPTEREWDIFSAKFLTLDSPASLPDGSGCWIRMIRMSVLRLQTGHQLLIPTNLSYGTLLTAACARRAVVLQY